MRCGAFRNVNSTFFLELNGFSLNRQYSLLNVRSVKKDTKRSSNTLLHLVSFFTERTLVVFLQVSLASLISKIHHSNEEKQKPSITYLLIFPIVPIYLVHPVFF